MLSKDSVKLLKWFQQNDDWFYYPQLEKKCPVFEYRAFMALKKNNLIDHVVDESDYPEYNPYGELRYPEQYRINDKGLAHLEYLWSSKIDRWVTRIISVLALVISIIALLSQLGILKLQSG